MKKYHNEKGYAMLIVLLLVVIILTVSATFFTASISNAKQERTVDTNNLAVVAAEMGTKYYVEDLKKDSRLAYDAAIAHISAEIEKYNRCQENRKNSSCNTVKTLSEIEEMAKEKYYGELATFSRTKAQSSPVSNIDSKGTRQYRLISQEPIKEEERVNVTLRVIGVSSSNEKELEATVGFDYPEFVQEKTVVTNPSETISDPDDIFKHFTPDNALNENPCPGNGACKKDGGVYSTEGDLSFNNPNKMEGFVWLHKGLLDAGENVNNLNIVLIVESLEFKNNVKNISGSLILLGKDNKSGRLTVTHTKQKGDMETKDNGKICINLDGFRDDDIRNVEFSGNIMYYSTSKNPTWLGKGNPERFNGTLTEFVEACSGLKPNGLEESHPNFQIGSSYTNFEMDVEY